MAMARLLLLSLSPALGSAAISASVYLDKSSGAAFAKSDVLDAKDAAATGKFTDDIKLTGWAELHIETNSDFSDAQQAYAAGYLEGALTQERIWQNYHNLFVVNRNWTKVPEDVPAPLVHFLQQNDEYIHNMTATTPVPEYWSQVMFIDKQRKGMLDGYNKVAPAEQTLTALQLNLLQSSLDIDDIMTAVMPQPAMPPYMNKTKQEFEIWLMERTHCSAMIKVDPTLKDVYFGHTTWSSYLELMKIFKTYNFNFNHPSTSAKTIRMPSRPGILVSIDDLYMMDSGLVSIETTNENFNTTLNVLYTKPTQLLYWWRVTLANRMASQGSEWVDVFARENSGTYNNQWMVMDMKRFTPGKQLNDGFFWVLEQIPGYCHSEDMTHVLALGYWPSYNVPWFEDIFEMSGYPEAIKEQGTEFLDYEMCVRAQIFRRDHGKVTDVESLKHMLRYNDYEHDPVSKGNPYYAISSRPDLLAMPMGKPHCFGGSDTKVSSYSYHQDGLRVEGQAGPTHQQPIFSFENTTAPCHFDEVLGLPEVWGFPFISFTNPTL